MAKGTLLDKRRRISDSDKRQLSLLMTLSWCMITASVIFAILISDYRRFENDFQQAAIDIEHRLQSNIRQSEAVLEGFAAFLSGKKQLDDASISDYARKIRQRFPSIAMLEVAEGVNQEDLPALVARQKKKGYAGFEVKAFDYQGQRQWRSLPELRRYYPLVYLSPLAEESRVVLGLDLASHDFLDKPMQRALATGEYQTSVPFKLVEGDDAYVMFMPVDGPEDIANGNTTQFIVLIVLRSGKIIAEIEPLLNDATSVRIYHNDRPISDSSHYLYQKASSRGLPFLSARYEVDLESDRRGFLLSLERRPQLSDISWSRILLAAVLGLLVYVYSKKFILKRYSRDIEWAKDEARLQFLASYDALTEMPNRRFLVSMLESRLEDSGGKLTLAMLFLDLDEFKQVNDVYGHKMGDVLLQEVARRIKKTLRKDDMAGRLGGDEFVVMLADYDSTDQIQQVIDKLRQEIEAPFNVEGRTLRIKVSIGAAFYPKDTDDLLDLLHLADKAMYTNKAGRRNPTTLAAKGLKPTSREPLYIHR